MIYAPKVQEASSVCSRARKGEIAFFLVNDSSELVLRRAYSVHGLLSRPRHPVALRRQRRACIVRLPTLATLTPRHDEQLLQSMRSEVVLPLIHCLQLEAEEMVRGGALWKIQCCAKKPSATWHTSGTQIATSLPGCFGKSGHVVQSARWTGSV